MNHFVTSQWIAICLLEDKFRTSSAKTFQVSLKEAILQTGMPGIKDVGDGFATNRMMPIADLHTCVELS